MDSFDITTLASIPLGALAVYLMYRLATNHLAHNTRALERMTAAQEEQADVWREFIAWMKGRLGGGDAPG